jgi:hypothetical protein
MHVRAGLVTEADAKKKWCPMSRLIDLCEDNRNDNAYNAWIDGSLKGYTKCVASNCMMWRSDGTGGYCGLAGLPYFLTE